MRTLPGTPAGDGFALPAEWEPHEGCWLIWPENGYAWRDGARPAQRAVAAIANAVADTGERVTMSVGAAQYGHARARLDGRVRVVETTTWLGWARDLAPTFVVDGAGRRRGVDFRFNGYGGQYPYWAVDAGFAGKVLDLTGTDRYRSPLVIEGGGFHVDGDGTCLVTDAGVLGPARNPRLGRPEVEAMLRDQLGVRVVRWIGEGLVNDPTGHVDNVACFVEPGVVCLAWTDDPDDPQSERSARALDELTGVTDARGRALRVEKLRLPPPLYSTDDEVRGVDPIGPVSPGPARLAASYCNFYLANGHLFMPLLDPGYDEPAAATLARLFPDRTVVGLPTRELLLGGGNIHCATHQVPPAAADPR